MEGVRRDFVSGGSELQKVDDINTRNFTGHCNNNSPSNKQSNVWKTTICIIRIIPFII